MKLYRTRVIALLFLTACSPELNSQNVAKQARGHGCSFDSTCGSHWSWWQNLSVRHPEYACRMRAAACLTRLEAKGSTLVSELEAAKSEMPERFDTGDGVLEYRACLDEAIAKIGGAAHSDAGLRACGS